MIFKFIVDERVSDLSRRRMNLRKPKNSSDEGYIELKIYNDIPSTDI